MRSLDAMHLASALAVADALTVFVVDNERLRSAAEQAVLDVVAPG